MFQRVELVPELGMVLESVLVPELVLVPEPVLELVLVLVLEQEPGLERHKQQQ